MCLPADQYADVWSHHISVQEWYSVIPLDSDIPRRAMASRVRGVS
jgi:hypothetical protein